MELSIVIPVLDEAETLPGLLADLARESEIAMEVLVVDGGSADASCDVAQRSLASHGLRGQVLVSERGRGRQLNCGAAKAQGEWLLFLHADSRFPDAGVLRQSVDRVGKQADNPDRLMVAGHFSLDFELASEQQDRLAYRFYRAKARSGRSGTIHGDQGFLVRADDFRSLGGFRQDLPVMEDSSFAENLRRTGTWLLLPGRIVTSTRRFQAEGLVERQTLNALMMNFLAIGWLDFVLQAPDLYRRQSRTARLDLLPFFELIHDLLAVLPGARRREVWLATGRYVRGQAWQIGFYLDCRNGRQRWTTWIDRWFLPCTHHVIGDLLSAALVRAWFGWTRQRLRRRFSRTGGAGNG